MSSHKSLEDKLLYTYSRTLSDKYRAFVIASMYLAGVRYRSLEKLGFKRWHINEVLTNRRFMEYVYDLMIERIFCISIMCRLYGINETIYPMPYLHLSLHQYPSSDIYYIHPYNIPKIREELVYVENKFDTARLDSVEQFIEHVNKINTDFKVKKFVRKKRKYIKLNKKLKLDGKRNMKRRRKRCVGKTDSSQTEH